MANLWVAKERLWRELLGRIDFDPAISLVDSFPVPACRFARAYRHRLLPEESAFGYDEMAKQTFYGLRAHLRLCWPGVIVGVSLAPADAHDLSVAEELLEGVQEGWALGDRNYWSPRLFEQLGEEQGLDLLAPYKSKKPQGIEPHCGHLLLPASWAFAAVFRGASHRLNFHAGLANSRSLNRPNSPFQDPLPRSASRSLSGRGRGCARRLKNPPLQRVAMRLDGSALSPHKSVFGGSEEENR